MTQPTPPRHLTAAPRLIFEIRRTVATMTSVGPGGGYASTEVALLADAALELQRDLGPELFTALLTVALAAEERDGELVVERPTALLVAQTGWYRGRASKFITALHEAGFLTTEQRAFPGRRGFTRSVARLAPDLYRRVDRRLSVVTHEHEVGAPHALLSGSYNAAEGPEANGDANRSTIGRNGDANRSTTGVPAGGNGGAASSSAGSSTVAKPNSDADRSTVDPAEARVAPGPNGAAPSGTVRPQHLHEDGDDGCHSSAVHDDDHARPPTRPAPPSPSVPLVDGTAALDPVRAVAAVVAAAPAVRVEEVPRLGDAHLRELLRDWGLFDADRVAARYPRHVLEHAVQLVISRWESVENPGAYLRKVLQQSLSPAPSPSGAAPAAAPSPPAPKQSAPARAPALQDTSEQEPVPVSALHEALEACTPQQRAQVKAAGDAAVANIPENLRGLAPLVRGARQHAMTVELRRLGLLAAEP